jgi:hypothetical protein
MVRIPPRVALAIALMLAAHACTQTGGPRHGGRRGGGDGGFARERGDRSDSGVTRLSANDRVRLHLTEVEIALKLIPDQAPLWQAYERGVIELISGREPDQETYRDDGALGEIDRRARAARNRAAAMERLSDDARKLYSSLDTEQKRVADQLLPGTVPAEPLGASSFPRD